MVLWLLNPEDRYALMLSTFAGLSTTIGGCLAVLKKPDEALLAFLLGIAIGVMALLSVIELIIRNIIENGFWGISAATVAGIIFYLGIEPLVPEMKIEGTESDILWDSEAGGGAAGAGGGGSRDVDKVTNKQHGARQPPGGMSRSRSGAVAESTLAGEGSSPPAPTTPLSPSDKGHRSPGHLLRLGFLMAITMTLHNFPEGFAVAFSSFTEIGPIMAIAIAVHNIPEGIIVAAPLYAATGSRWKAIGLATASGLSEPLGALLALWFIKPFLTPLRLQWLLAFVGGLMLAVCVVELWPEAVRCRCKKRNMWAGIAVGALIMGGTLLMGV